MSLVCTSDSKTDNLVLYTSIKLLHSISKKNTLCKIYGGFAHTKDKYRNPAKLYRVHITIKERELLFDIYRGMPYNRLRKAMKNKSSQDIVLSDVINICMSLASPAEIFDVIENS